MNLGPSSTPAQLLDIIHRLVFVKIYLPAIFEMLIIHSASIVPYTDLYFLL